MDEKRWTEFEVYADDLIVRVIAEKQSEKPEFVIIDAGDDNNVQLSFDQAKLIVHEIDNFRNRIHK